MLTIPGEVLASIGGLVVAVPFFYQMDRTSTDSEPTRFPTTVWHLWSLGYYSLALYFGNRPNPIHRRHHHRHHYSDIPQSPHVMWVVGLVLALLVELCVVRDVFLTARAHDRTWIGLRNKITGSFKVLYRPVLAAAALESLFWGLNFSLTNPWTYTAVTGSVCLIFCTGAIAGSSWAAWEIGISLDTRRNPGIHPLPITMQLLGIFAQLMACVLVYVNPDWWGVGLLACLGAADLAFLIVAAMRQHKSKEYIEVELEPIETPIPSV